MYLQENNLSMMSWKELDANFQGKKNTPWINRSLIFHCCSVRGKQLESQNLNTCGSCLLKSSKRTKTQQLPVVHLSIWVISCAIITELNCFP